MKLKRLISYGNPELSFSFALIVLLKKKCFAKIFAIIFLFLILKIFFLRFFHVSKINFSIYTQTL